MPLDGGKCERHQLVFVEVLLGPVITDDHTKYVGQSAASRQSATGQAELQYILCNVLTAVAMCQASEVPTV